MKMADEPHALWEAPGPWRRVEPDLMATSARIVDAKGCGVAVIFGVEGMRTDQVADCIAAAPEMLKALKGVLLTLEWLRRKGHDVADDILEIHTVIKKAEGGKNDGSGS